MKNIYIYIYIFFHFLIIYKEREWYESYFNINRQIIIERTFSGRERKANRELLQSTVAPPQQQTCIVRLNLIRKSIG